MKKKFLISFIIVIFLLMIFGTVFIYERGNRNLPIKDNVIIENDNTYNPNNEEPLDLSKLNSSVSGEQETNVSIEDVYGNETEEDFKIIKQEKEKEETEEVTEEKTITITKPNNSSNKIEVTTSNETTNLNNKLETTDDNVSQEENPEESISKEENVEDTPICTHSSENYYNSKAEAEAIYKAEIKHWGDKWVNNEIDDETYYKNCPDGYEVWTCPYCEKWTISFYY